MMMVRRRRPRLAAERRFAAIVARVVDDLGGPDRVSPSRMVLVQQFAAMTVMTEQQSNKILRGEPVSPAEYRASVGALSRLAARLGLAAQRAWDASELPDIAPDEAEIDAALADDAALRRAWGVGEAASNVVHHPESRRSFVTRVRRG
jgi:hypothetical protein